MDAYLHPVLDFSLECVGGGQFAAGVLPREESESGRTAISCRAIAVPFFLLRENTEGKENQYEQ